MAAVPSTACRISGCFAVCLKVGARKNNLSGEEETLGRKRWSSDSTSLQIAGPMVQFFTQQHKQCLRGTAVTGRCIFSLSNSAIWPESKFKLTSLSSISGPDYTCSMTMSWWWMRFWAQKQGWSSGTYPSSQYLKSRVILMKKNVQHIADEHLTGHPGWPAYQKLKTEAQCSSQFATYAGHRLRHSGNSLLTVFILSGRDP